MTISAVLPTLTTPLTASVAALSAKENMFSGKLGAAQSAYQNADDSGQQSVGQLTGMLGQLGQMAQQAGGPAQALGGQAGTFGSMMQQAMQAAKGGGGSEGGASPSAGPQAAAPGGCRAGGQRRRPGGCGLYRCGRTSAAGARRGLRCRPGTGLGAEARDRDAHQRDGRDERHDEARSERPPVVAAGPRAATRCRPATGGAARAPAPRRRGRSRSQDVTLAVTPDAWPHREPVAHYPHYRCMGIL